jgi:hypothetical protein
MATFVFASILKGGGGAGWAEVDAIKDNKALVRAKHLAENIMNKNELRGGKITERSLEGRGL